MLFFDQFEETIRDACRLLVSDKSRWKSVSAEILTAFEKDDFNCLSSYRGAAPLVIHVQLATSELVEQRVLLLVGTGGETGWIEFCLFYGTLIEGWVAKGLLADDRTDGNTFVLAALKDNDCRRIKAYSGQRPDGDTSLFEGYLKTVVKRLVVDYGRQKYERRRLPAAIERLPDPVDRILYAAIRWEGAPEDALLLQPRLESSKAVLKSSPEVRATIRALRIDDIAAALVRIKEALKGKPIGEGARAPLPVPVDHYTLPNQSQTPKTLSTRPNSTSWWLRPSVNWRFSSRTSLQKCKSS